MPTGAALAITAAGTAYSANRANAASKEAGIMAAQSETSGARTPFSTITPHRDAANNIYKMTRIDPRIRAMRERSLTRLPGYRSTLTDAYSALSPNLQEARQGFKSNYQSLMSNENPFIQARVNPLLQRAALQRGEVVRSMTNRGLGGSSFYTQGLGNFEREVAGGVGDQQALATQETIEARRQALSDMVGIDSQVYNSALSSIQALQGLDAAEQAVAAQNLAQELSSLGLSQVDSNAILGAAGLSLQAAQMKNETMGRAFDVSGRLMENYLRSRQSSGSTSGTGSEYFP